MSTVKFVSKNSNYMIVLRPGIEGNRALGTHAIPGIYVKFQAGILDVKEDSIIDMLREHPGYGSDFIEIKDEEVDPFLEDHNAAEPDHVITELKYGTVQKTVGAPIKTKLTPAMKKLIEGEALKMLPSILKKNPEILKNIVLDLASEMKEKEEKKEEKVDAKSTKKE